MSQPENPNTLDHPALPLDQARRLVAGETSLRSRVVYCLLLVTSLCMTCLVVALLLTEPQLPIRTRIAFAALVAIGLAWSGFFGWVLARRRVLYAAHRVIAGRLATLASGIFVAGCLTLAALVPEQAAVGLAAGGLGAVLVAVSIGVLWRATRRRAQLLSLRSRLESELAATAGRS